MRNDFKDYARTFLPIMRTFFGFVLHMNVPSKITIFEFRYTGVCFITSRCLDTDRMTSAASCQQLVSKKNKPATGNI